MKKKEVIIEEEGKSVGYERGEGGHILVTITSKDGSTVHVPLSVLDWVMMHLEDFYDNEKYATEHIR